jgi:predicted DNA-binding protein
MTKKQAGIRLSDEGKDLLEKLAKHYGVSQAAILEILIRKEARNEGLANKNGNVE